MSKENKSSSNEELKELSEQILSSDLSEEELEESAENLDQLIKSTGATGLNNKEE